MRDGRLDNVQAILGFVPASKQVHVLNKTTIDGWSSLHVACFFNHVPIVRYLLTRNANCNRETKDNWTPLQLVCYLGHFECVEALVTHPEIQVNKMTASRGTGLHIAASRGHLNIIKRLIQGGSCLTLADNIGQVPLDLAATPEVEGYLQKCMGKKWLPRPRSFSTAPPMRADWVYMVQKLKLSDSQVYLVLQPTQGLLSRFTSEAEFLDNEAPERVYHLQSLQDVRLVSRRLFQAKLAFNFRVESKTSSAQYYTFDEEQSKEWVIRIIEAIEFCQLVRIGLPSPKAPGSPIPPVIELPKHGEFQRDTEIKVTGAETPIIVLDCPVIQITPPEVEPQVPYPVAVSPEEVKKPGISLNDFEILDEIGSGSFSKVYKVQKNDDSSIFAMKTLSKDFLRKRRQLKYAISEGKIWQQLDHPFIVKLHYAFQTNKSLHFVVDYCSNGTLAEQLATHGIFTEDEAKFFAIELLLVLEYLHKLDIIYRDLKPENLLLDDRGQIRLTDFGLAKDSKSEVCATFVGSPAYLAPEMLSDRIATKASDVYAFGLVLYELIEGKPPFYSTDIEELFDNIRNSQLQFPSHMSSAMTDFLSVILSHEAARRPTIKQCKQHALFADVNWESYLNGEVKSPARLKLRT